MRIRYGHYGIALLAAALGMAAGRPARNAQRSESPEFVMVDFEGANPLSTPLLGSWYFADDRYTPTANDMIPGNSTITSFDWLGRPLLDSAGRYDTASFPKGRLGGEGTRSLRVAYVLGDRMLSCGGSCRYQPFIDFGFIFTGRSATLDLTGATAISFWGKSDSDSVAVDVGVGTEDTTRGAANYAQTFVIGPAWTRCAIRLEASTELKQPDGSPVKPFDPARAYGLIFTLNRGANARFPANGLSIDDIVLANWRVPDGNPDGLGIPIQPALGSGEKRIWPSKSRAGIGFRTGAKGLPVDLRGRALPVP